MARTHSSSDAPRMNYLGHLGPHRIASGDLAPAGLPGMVFAPTTGRDLPVVALGHGWLQPVARYTGTMRHLASWGFVVVAPATERGPVPSYAGLATDLSRALRAVTGGTLAGGIVSADPAKMGILGHSLGAGAAMIAAATDPAVRAVVTVTAATTATSLRAAASVTVPVLHLISQDSDVDADAGVRFARVGAGEVQVRKVKGGEHFGLAEGRHWTTFLAGDGADKRMQQATRTLATAFFLRHLAGQDQLADDLHGKVPGTDVIDLSALSAS